MFAHHEVHAVFDPFAVEVHDAVPNGHHAQGDESGGEFVARVAVEQHEQGKGQQKRHEVGERNRFEGLPRADADFYHIPNLVVFGFDFYNFFGLIGDAAAPLGGAAGATGSHHQADLGFPVADFFHNALVLDNLHSLKKS